MAKDLRKKSRDITLAVGKAALDFFVVYTLFLEGSRNTFLLPSALHGEWN